MFLVDSHCHLDLLEPKSELENQLSRAQNAGVHYFLNVCVSLKEFSTVLNTAQSKPNISASVGSHPNEIDEPLNSDHLLGLAQHKKVIAIGETGLDYYRTTAHLDKQRERFRIHIQVAKRIKKPLIIHTRQAKEDTLAIMKEESAKDVCGVMHCFTEDWAFAKKAIDLGFYISFSGIVTFKNATYLHEVAEKIPLDSMLVETDAPYLAPNPYRGKQNEPAYVRHTAEYIAGLRNITLDVLAHQTTTNFFKLFKGAEKPHV